MSVDASMPFGRVGVAIASLRLGDFAEAERIAAEMRRLLPHPNRRFGLELLQRTRLLPAILPEAEQLDAVARALGERLYAGLGFLFAAGGFGVAARQVWLQHLPPDQVPACGPDLFFMVENFPLTRTLQNLFKGSGQCAEVTWRFLGLSIAEWSLLCFAGLAA